MRNKDILKRSERRFRAGSEAFKRLFGSKTDFRFNFGKYILTSSGQEVELHQQSKRNLLFMWVMCTTVVTFYLTHPVAPKVKETHHRIMFRIYPVNDFFL